MANVGSCAGPEEMSVLMDLLSHDILNRNQATLSYLELIHTQPGHERRTKDFAQMAASQVKASSMLLDSIKRFVAMNRMGSVPSSDVDLTEVLAAVAKEMADMFPQKRVTVDSSDLSAGAKVRGGNCVRDLLANLVANLVQLTPQDDVVIAFSDRRSAGHDHRIDLTVVADAAAMPHGVDGAAFSSPVGVDVSKMTRVSGVVFAGSIARALGGCISQRTAEPGCVFEVSLPGRSPR